MDTYVTLNYIPLDNKWLSLNAKSALFCNLINVIDIYLKCVFDVPNTTYTYMLFP